MTQAEENRQSDPNEHDRRATAYHEAGHAVMALALGRPLEKVTIAPGKIPYGPATLGMCKIQKGRFKPSKDELEDDMLILLAGMAAESQVTGRYCKQGAAYDLNAVAGLAASRAGSEDQIRRVVKRALNKAENILEDEECKLALESIAAELLSRETISGRSARHLYEEAVRRASR
ncbi:MAG: cell division protein FtsH [Pirellulales bacterium]